MVVSFTGISRLANLKLRRITRDTWSVLLEWPGNPGPVSSLLLLMCLLPLPLEISPKRLYREAERVGYN